MNKPLILALALAGFVSVASAAPTASVLNTTPVATGAPAARAPLAAVPQAAVAPSLTSAAPDSPVASVTAPAAPPTPQVALAPSGSQDADQDGLVNPFNGKALSQDQLQLELERSKFRTQLLEEKLKQTTTQEEIKSVPARKAVELAQAETAQKKEEAAQKDLDASMKAKAEAAAAQSTQLQAAKPVVKSKKALAREKAEQAAAAKRAAEESAARAANPPADLVAVISGGATRAVVMEIDGAVTTIADGDPSPAGVVHVMDDDSATIGGRLFRVHGQTLGRFVSSDQKPASGVAIAGAPGAGSNVTALPPALPANGNAVLPPPIPGLQAAIPGTRATGVPNLVVPSNVATAFGH